MFCQQSVKHTAFVCPTMETKTFKTNIETKISKVSNIETERVPNSQVSNTCEIELR